MNKKNCLFFLLLIVFFNLSSQVSSTAEKFKTLQFKGVIDAPGKDNFELSECIAGSAMLAGIISQTKSKEQAVDSSFVKGEYTYTYYVDNYEKFAGFIKFKFEYIIKKGQIHYRFYDFEHEKSDSDFESIGLLPEKPNEKVRKVFTEKQYDTIMTDLKMNIAHSLRLIVKYCVNN